VQALFPSARTLRWDRDTTRQKDAHEIIMSHFSAHRADVLIGTQMLAKVSTAAGGHWWASYWPMWD